MEPVSVAQSHVVAVTVEDAYARTLPIDLTVIFDRWFGPLPPIRQVREQDSEWGTVGQTRTVALKGGGTMREELLAVDAPRSFDYRLTGITGALAPLVDHIDGAWSFAAAGTGTEITWSWVLHPKSAVTRPVVVLLGRLWNGYARRALATLSRQLVPRG